MIEEKIVTKALPSQVWDVWKRASYWDSNGGEFHAGQYGKAYSDRRGKGAVFKILNVEEGRSFLLEWRAPCVKIQVDHDVRCEGAGSVITYRFSLKGWLAPFLNCLLKGRIRHHLQKALKEFSELLDSCPQM